MNPAAIGWPRLLAILIGAIVLASCRSVAPPAGSVMGRRSVTGSGIIHHSSADCRTCRDAPCGGDCHDESCRPCPALAVPPPPPVPLARVCKVCDGGDAGRPARAVGGTGIGNLTAGDTVARFRGAADPSAELQEDAAATHAAGQENDECLGVANCACVCAPRFASVREIVRPREDVAPRVLAASSVDEGPAVARVRQRFRASTQRVPPGLARLATPELAVIDSAPPVDLEERRLPTMTPYVCVPAEDVGQDRPQLSSGRERPKIALAFDVPLAWTCLTQAQVLMQDTAAETVTVDRGTAVIRLKCPGRAELSLCKTAGGKTVRAGEELDFTIAILNSGDRRLEGIVLADALPKRLSYVPGSADSTLPADFVTETADDGAVVLKWIFKEPLPVGGSGFVRFRTLVR